MKSFILFMLLSLSIPIQAKLFTVSPGETKTVTVKTFGAATASAVTVTGVDGVTATLGRRKGPNEVEVRLSAQRNAWGGNGKLNVTLAAGVNVNELYVYSMPRITIDSPQEVIAGRKARVKLAWVHPDSQLAALNRSNYGYSNIPMTKTGNARYEFDVTTNQNIDQTKRITLSERGQTREFSVRFRRDNSIPQSLTAPTYPSSERSKTVSTRNQSRDVTIRWNARQGANAYIVSYKKHHETRYTDIQVNQTATTVLRNLPVGENSWKVRAVYDPALSGSTLTKVVSPPTSPATIYITQNSVENKPKPRKRRG